MLPYQFYRYIDLPKLPDAILSQINFNFDQYDKKDAGRHGDIYTWSDSFNQSVNQWCQQNICSSMWWGFQIIRGDLPAHKDNGTLAKFVYLIDDGGPTVVTEWWDDKKSKVIDSVILETHRWHILKVDNIHSVRGIVPGRVRFSITGRIF